MENSLEETYKEDMHSGWICSCGNWIWTTDIPCEMCGTIYIDNLRNNTIVKVD